MDSGLCGLGPGAWAERKILSLGRDPQRRQKLGLEISWEGEEDFSYCPEAIIVALNPIQPSGSLAIIGVQGGSQEFRSSGLPRVGLEPLPLYSWCSAFGLLQCLFLISKSLDEESPCPINFGLE